MLSFVEAVPEPRRPTTVAANSVGGGHALDCPTTESMQVISSKHVLDQERMRPRTPSFVRKEQVCRSGSKNTRSFGTRPGLVAETARNLLFRRVHAESPTSPEYVISVISISGDSAVVRHS